MKKILSILALLFSVNCFAQSQYVLTPVGESTIARPIWGNSYLGKTYFNCFAVEISTPEGDQFYGLVEKPGAMTRTYNFKIDESVVATHSAYFYSCGSMFDSLKEFEVVNGQKKLLGYIRGIYDTPDAAEFHFFDENNALFAKAHLDKSWKILTIKNLEGETLTLCSSTFKDCGYYFNYYWTLQEISNTSMDGRFLFPFMAFISEVWGA